VTNLIGSYECKADAKGRVMLPVSLQEQLAAILKEGFVIKPSVHHECLELFPRAAFDKMMQRVLKKNRFHPKIDNFIRVLSAGVKPVSIDSTGRLQIPKTLVADAGISKEVTLIASGDRVEIWDTAKSAAVIEASLPSFKELASEIMGGFGDED